MKMGKKYRKRLLLKEKNVEKNKKKQQIMRKKKVKIFHRKMN